MNVSAKSDLYIQSFFKSWWQRIVSCFNVDDYYLFLLFPFFSKVFLHRNWLVLLFRFYLLSTVFSIKTFSESTVLCFKAFFDILSPPFYFAKLAQTVLARAHILLPQYFFRLFGCSCSLIKNSQSPRGENNIGYLLPCSPAFCLLVFST